MPARPFPALLTAIAVPAPAAGEADPCLERRAQGAGDHAERGARSTVRGSPTDRGEVGGDAV